MHAGIIFFLVILGSVLFHIFTPWYWTDIASNWQGMDDTITLTFWVGGGVFVAVCLFMVYCVFRYSYKEGRKACLLYTSPSPRDLSTSRMPSSA